MNAKGFKDQTFIIGALQSQDDLVATNVIKILWWKEGLAFDSEMVKMDHSSLAMPQRTPLLSPTIYHYFTSKDSVPLVTTKQKQPIH